MFCFLRRFWSKEKKKAIKYYLNIFLKGAKGTRQFTGLGEKEYKFILKQLFSKEYDFVIIKHRSFMNVYTEVINKKNIESCNGGVDEESDDS